MCYSAFCIIINLVIEVKLGSIKAEEKPGKSNIPFLKIGGDVLMGSALLGSSDTMSMSIIMTIGSVIVSGSYRLLIVKMFYISWFSDFRRKRFGRSEDG